MVNSHGKFTTILRACLQVFFSVWKFWKNGEKTGKILVDNFLLCSIFHTKTWSGTFHEFFFRARNYSISSRFGSLNVFSLVLVCLLFQSSHGANWVFGQRRPTALCFVIRFTTVHGNLSIYSEKYFFTYILAPPGDCKNCRLNTFPDRSSYYST